MLIADGGGGYGGTDWMSKDVRFMWSTIADQETDPHFDVVGGWRRTAELILAHMAQVQVYRDNLASVWPPTKSPAAAAYLDRLDTLIGELKATHDAASANYTAFSTVTLTLSMARNKLQPILEQYQANEQLNLDWQAKQEAAEAKTPAFAPVFKIPPVAAGRQEELNRQARVIMYDLSNTLLSGQAALKKPEPYKPGREFKEDPPQGGDDGYGSGFAVPPVIPAPGSANAGSSGASITPISGSITSPAQPQNGVPVGPGSVISGPGGGPILGGIGSPPIAPPSPPAIGPIPGPTPTPPGPGTSIIGPVGGGGAFVPSSGLVPNSGGGRGPSTSLPKSGASPVGRMAMPSGGVIGATPGSGMIGQVPANGTGTRPGATARANPVGGVIGQQGAGAPGRPGTPTGRSASGMNTPLPSQAGQRRGRRDETPEATNWDPDNPWVTDEGVDPVVLPSSAPGRIDPGPAIGYSR